MNTTAVVATKEDVTEYNQARAHRKSVKLNDSPVSTQDTSNNANTTNTNTNTNTNNNNNNNNTTSSFTTAAHTTERKPTTTDTTKPKRIRQHFVSTHRTERASTITTPTPVKDEKPPEVSTIY